MKELFAILSTIIGVVGAFIFLAVLFLGFGTVITWWAWNTLMPFVFHLPAINLWQALAFNLLARVFGGINFNQKDKS